MDQTIAEQLTAVIRNGRIVIAEQWDTPDGEAGRRIVADTGNGWGVSVVQWTSERPDILNPRNTIMSSSYGGRDGLWEAALTYGASEDYRLAHDNMHELWGDVMGWLSPDQVWVLITEVMGYAPPAEIRPRESWE